MANLSEIRAAADAKAEATAEAERLDEGFRDRMRDAFADDSIRLKDLIEVTGLSKARQCQIRDRQR